MPDMHATEEELILHYYGEPASDTRVADHVAACTQCRAALKELSDVLALVDAQATPEPLAGLEERVWTRLQPTIAAPRVTWWSRLFDGAPRWALAGGVAVAVLAAFIAGRVSGPGAPTTTPATEVADSVARPNAAERVMTSAVGDHLDESQMVLLELLNGDAAKASDIADEQDRARDLVATTRLYRQTADRVGDEGVREVLDALERVLLEIANAPADVSARELEALRSDIEQRGILFRLRVVASEMRAREHKDVMGPNVGP